MFPTGGVDWLCGILLVGVVVAKSFQWLFIAVCRSSSVNKDDRHRCLVCMFDDGKEDEINIVFAVAGEEGYRSVVRLCIH